MTEEHDNAARSRRTSPIRNPQNRGAVGRLMVAVAVFGVIVAVVGSIVAWRVVGTLDDSGRQTLTVTIQTIDSIEDSLDLAVEVISSTTESVDDAAASLAALDDSFESATGVVEEIDDLTEVVGPTIEEAATTLRRLENIGDGVDDVLGELSSIPFGPDYDPDQSLGDTIGDLATELEALPAEFEQTSEDLDDFESSVGDLQTEVAALASSVRQVSERLEGSDLVVTQYRSNLRSARTVAVDARDDLGSDVGLLRAILLFGGLNLALAQIVPYWVGRELLDEESTDGSLPPPPPTS